MNKKDSNISWLVEVKENSKGELYIELPDELLNQLKWNIGDRFVWKEIKTGWTLKKITTKKKHS